MQCTISVPKENTFGSGHVLFFVTNIPLNILQVG